MPGSRTAFRTSGSRIGLLLALPAGALAGPDALSRSEAPDPVVRAAAAGDLAEDPSAEASGALVRLLRDDGEPSVRRAAAEAMARTRNPAFHSFLERAAERDPDREVRRAARTAAEQVWPWTRSPGKAAGFSLLCPGCGYFYLRRPGRAASFLVPSVAMLGGALALVADNEGAPKLGEPSDPNLDAKDPIAVQLLMATQNLWLYGVFAAYRDARLLRQDLGYKRPVSREGLADLASAPFRPRVLARPWVWVGVPVAVGAATALVWALSPEDLGEGSRSLPDAEDVNFLGRRYDRASGVALGELYFAALFVPVAVGEEALFRGVLQPALGESVGMWEGWALASLIFGAAHILNFWDGERFDAEGAAVAVPFITAAGAYLGLASIKTGHRLETSVAVHFWYDFGLSTVLFVADPEHQPFVARWSTPF